VGFEKGGVALRHADLPRAQVGKPEGTEQQSCGVNPTTGSAKKAGLGAPAIKQVPQAFC